MDLFIQLFGGLLAFVYHCFDRIVIYGYLSGLSRPERVVNFFHQVVGVPVVSREILGQRTADYQNWVETFARSHRIPIEWAEKGVRKENHVLMVRAGCDDCLDWSAVLGGLGGGRRLFRSEREGVYGVVTVIGTRVGALLTQQRLQLVAVERPDLVRKSSISSNTASASSGVQVRGISTVSGRRCAGSVIGLAAWS